MFLCCHETEDGIIKLPFSQKNVPVCLCWGLVVAQCQGHMACAAGRCEKCRVGDGAGNLGQFEMAVAVPWSDLEAPVGDFRPLSSSGAPGGDDGVIPGVNPLGWEWVSVQGCNPSMQTPAASSCKSDVKQPCRTGVYLCCLSPFVICVLLLLFPQRQLLRSISIIALPSAITHSLTSQGWLSPAFVTFSLPPALKY